ncbi:MAG: RNA polymerase sigma factor [Bradymonadaceae bacterium]
MLYVMATRHCLNRLRSRKRRPETAASQLVYSIARLNDGEADGRSRARFVLRRLFDQNPETSQVIAVLHYHDGLTLNEVAEEVGMSVSGVRRRLRVLRQQLHQLEVQA